MADQFTLARAIDYMTCPECGEPGSPAVGIFQGGVTIVIPSFQCSTEDCTYNEDGPTAWTLAFNS